SRRPGSADPHRPGHRALGTRARARDPHPARMGRAPGRSPVPGRPGQGPVPGSLRRRYLLRRLAAQHRQRPPARAGGACAAWGVERVGRFDTSLSFHFHRERPMNQRIRVGIVGLNPGIHWAAMAHMPALAALAHDYEVVGVANTSLASAQRAAEAFGLRHAFRNAQALVDSPEVDLVVITVKVPHHHALVTTALNAGKHVYCEWPLGNGLVEARELSELAQARGVVAAVGTQMRVAPDVEHLRQLIADGYVGQ